MFSAKVKFMPPPWHFPSLVRRVQHNKCYNAVSLASCLQHWLYSVFKRTTVTFCLPSEGSCLHYQVWVRVRSRSCLKSSVPSGALRCLTFQHGRSIFHKSVHRCAKFSFTHFLTQRRTLNFGVIRAQMLKPVWTRRKCRGKHTLLRSSWGLSNSWQPGSDEAVTKERASRAKQHWTHMIWRPNLRNHSQKEHCFCREALLKTRSYINSGPLLYVCLGGDVFGEWTTASSGFV